MRVFVLLNRCKSHNNSYIKLNVKDKTLEESATYTNEIKDEDKNEGSRKDWIFWHSFKMQLLLDVGRSQVISDSGEALMDVS